MKGVDDLKKDFEELKEEYKNIPIPENLTKVINQSINDYRREEVKMKNKKIFKSIIAASLIVISSFTIGVNTSKSFATSVKKIPVISQLVELVSFKSFELDSEIVKAKVNIPAVKGVESKALANQINEEINERMSTHLEAGKDRAREYKKAFVETGGKAEDFRPIIIEIDYDLKSYNDNILSFSVHYFESLASSYAQTYYYTIDLEAGKLLTLEDILGTDYENKISQQVSEKINKALEESPSSYFEGDMGFSAIKKDQSFYINNENQLVVVFDKYEIAPGSSGQPEFIIEE
jgi:hypothetical protein